MCNNLCDKYNFIAQEVAVCWSPVAFVQAGRPSQSHTEDIYFVFLIFLDAGNLKKKKKKDTGGDAACLRRFRAACAHVGTTKLSSLIKCRISQYIFV